MLLLPNNIFVKSKDFVVLLVVDINSIKKGQNEVEEIIVCDFYLYLFATSLSFVEQEIYQNTVQEKK